MNRDRDRACLRSIVDGWKSLSSGKADLAKRLVNVWICRCQHLWVRARNIFAFQKRLDRLSTDFMVGDSALKKMFHLLSCHREKISSKNSRSRMTGWKKFAFRSNYGLKETLFKTVNNIEKLQSLHNTKRVSKIYTVCTIIISKIGSLE